MARSRVSLGGVFPIPPQDLDARQDEAKLPIGGGVDLHPLSGFLQVPEQQVEILGGVGMADFLIGIGAAPGEVGEVGHRVKGVHGLYEGEKVQHVLPLGLRLGVPLPIR